MNTLKNFAKVLTVCMTLAFAANAQAQVWGEIGDPGQGHGGGYPNRGGEWQQVDEVHFTDDKTAVAIQNCKNARAADFRCNATRDYQCSPCSEIKHSDHSSYVVYQLVNNGGYYPGPGRPGPGPVRPGPGRPGRPGPGPGYPGNPGYGTPEREFVQTFHFYDNKTAVARQKCELERSRMVECRGDRNFECSPCTIESHTDHSQFDLYRIVFRRW
ncbi:hypothetical protein [Bdellovibrio sp. HCB337]|uniref:hypothetical protein n=1 Tax=Bdellovibrio sp. HCB337 TaxID=3394358 RepID=UPI0039A542B5